MSKLILFGQTAKVAMFYFPESIGILNSKCILKPISLLKVLHTLFIDFPVIPMPKCSAIIRTAYIDVRWLTFIKFPLIVLLQ